MSVALLAKASVPDPHTHTQFLSLHAADIFVKFKRLQGVQTVTFLAWAPAIAVLRTLEPQLISFQEVLA
jgi:hypothetical protein